MSHEPIRHANTLIFPASLDPDAVTVVNRLNEAGLESYFVGGCVRDLLLGLIPKDFDVSTAARPRQIRRLFRNSRIIGRRFKLAHVHFGRNIIEVATFRRTPEGSGEPGVTPSGELDAGDLLITRDNEFGTAEQDAVRRDFTINALLYDVRTGEVIDYVGGVADLNDRVLRTIGDPLVRFAEDPVRMLRAVKFMSRLGLRPAPDVEAALHTCAELIERSAPPRVLEEIYKLMACGRAGAALTRLLDHGLLQRLLPEVSGYWSQHRDELTATGEALDLIDRGRRVVSNAFLLATLCLRPWQAAVAERPEGDPLLRSHELFDGAALRMSIPRRDIAGMRQLLLTQLRLEGRRRSRRFRMRDFLARPSTEEALQLLHLAARAGYADPESHAEWVQRIAEMAPEDRPFGGSRAPDVADDEAGGGGGTDELGPAHREPGARRRRRRRRGGRRHRGRGREGRLPSGMVPTGAGSPVGEAGDDEPSDVPPSQPGAWTDTPGVATGGEAGGAVAGGEAAPAGSGQGAGGRRRGRRRGGRGRRGRRHRDLPGDSATQADELGPAPAASAGGEGGEAGAIAPAPGLPDNSAGASRDVETGRRPRRRRGGRRHRGRGRGGEPDGASAGGAQQQAGTQEAAAQAAPSDRGGHERGRRDKARGDRNRRRGSKRGGSGVRDDQRDSGSQHSEESLSPARPSKASEGAPGSRLRDNPESVEDLFDW